MSKKPAITDNRGVISFQDDNCKEIDRIIADFGFRNKSEIYRKAFQKGWPILLRELAAENKKRSKR
jgi:metal-responsive CopG/Arc/MetJ family transcriptional regulator